MLLKNLPTKRTPSAPWLEGKTGGIAWNGANLATPDPAAPATTATAVAAAATAAGWVVWVVPTGIPQQRSCWLRLELTFGLHLRRKQAPAMEPLANGVGWVEGVGWGDHPVGWVREVVGWVGWVGWVVPTRIP